METLRSTLSVTESVLLCRPTELSGEVLIDFCLAPKLQGPPVQKFKSLFQLKFPSFCIFCLIQY